MEYSYYSVVSAAGLFLGMLALLETGRRIGRLRLKQDAEGARAGLGAVEGALFGLLGLLIAFTFSGAAARFDVRRQMIGQEANEVGTAWLRIDLLPAAVQPEMRARFREYLDARLATYRKLPDLAAARVEFDRSAQLQGVIWSRAAASCLAQPNPAVTSLVLPALNQMFDTATTRLVSAQTHPPAIIFVMLGALALAGALLAGYGMAAGRSRSWVHILGFAIVMSATVYVILDLEYPRLGLIRVDAADALLVKLRADMN